MKWVTHLKFLILSLSIVLMSPLPFYRKFSSSTHDVLYIYICNRCYAFWGPGQIKMKSTRGVVPSLMEHKPIAIGIRIATASLSVWGV